MIERNTSSEVELRESVHAATCKSEEFNQFVQWIFFYNNGMIQENLRYAQDKMIAYNDLVANLVILHNVDSMSKAINKLKRAGFSNGRRSFEQFIALPDRTYQLAGNVLAQDSKEAK